MVGVEQRQLSEFMKPRTYQSYMRRKKGVYMAAHLAEESSGIVRGLLDSRIWLRALCDMLKNPPLELF
jgi:hypothetical protein